MPINSFKILNQESIVVNEYLFISCQATASRYKPKQRHSIKQSIHIKKSTNTTQPLPLWISSLTKKLKNKEWISNHKKRKGEKRETTLKRTTHTTATTTIDFIVKSPH
jgi:hypothetical protein